MKVEKLNTIEDVLSFCKSRGFVYPNSEIYGSFSGFWDYGPVGTELKNKIKQSWWKKFVRDKAEVVGIDGSIIMHPRTWEASGHVESFTDPMIDCKTCKSRFRLDTIAEQISDKKKEKLISELKEHVDENNKNIISEINSLEESLTEQFTAILESDTLSDGLLSLTNCPNCGTKGNFTNPRSFNLMFKTFIGPVESADNVVYLRPETAQGIFVNFLNVQ